MSGERSDERAIIFPGEIHNKTESKRTRGTKKPKACTHLDLNTPQKTEIEMMAMMMRMWWLWK